MYINPDITTNDTIITSTTTTTTTTITITITTACVMLTGGDRLLQQLLYHEPETVYASPDTSVAASAEKTLLTLSKLADRELVAIVAWAKQVPGKLSSSRCSSNSCCCCCCGSFVSCYNYNILTKRRINIKHSLYMSLHKHFFGKLEVIGQQLITKTMETRNMLTLFVIITSILCFSTSAYNSLRQSVLVPGTTAIKASNIYRPLS